VPLPDEALEKLRAYRRADLSRRGSNVGEVWDVPHYLVAYVVQAKNRPCLVAAVLGPADARARAFAIEGTSRAQRHKPPLCLSLVAGEAGVRVDTHFRFVPSRLQQFRLETLVDACSFWGELAPGRLQDLEAAIAASRIVVLRRARGIEAR
jgi:hypothetical protein